MHHHDLHLLVPAVPGSGGEDVNNPISRLVCILRLQVLRTWIACQIPGIIEGELTADQAESRSKSSDSEGRNTETIEP